MNPQAHGHQQQHGHHNHSHRHGHSHGHSHHAGCAHHREVEIQPEQYFSKIEEMKKNDQNQLYWMQILKGTYFDKRMQAMGCHFVSSLNCQILTGVVGMFHMMLNFECIPNIIRPFLSGMFWPLVILLFIHRDILKIDLAPSITSTIIILPLVLYTLVALRGPGSLSTDQNIKKTNKAFSIRPYLQNPALTCPQCKVLKAFRSNHCPICKNCIPKFTRHSLVFGTCVGAANQILAMLFFLSMSILSIFALYNFWFTEQYGLITKVMYYSLNIYLSWAAFTQFCTFLIMNIGFGLTEFQSQVWIMMQYLMKLPSRQFKNNVGKNFCHNLKQSVSALFGIPGFQALLDNERKEVDEIQKYRLNEEDISNQDELGFPQLEQNKNYVVNWAKAYFYLIPQIPNHPQRQKVLGMMKMDQPRMIESFRMMKKFKEQAQREHPQIPEMQLQQIAMSRMQEHIMKNGMPNQMRPPPQQQRTIQLQMLAHMKQQFKDNKQFYDQFQKLENDLKNNEISTDQVAEGIRKIQNRILQVKMTAVLEQHQKVIEQQQKNKTNKKQGDKKQFKTLVKEEDLLGEGQENKQQIASSELKSPKKQIQNIVPENSVMQQPHQNPFAQQQRMMMMMQQQQQNQMQNQMMQQRNPMMMQQNPAMQQHHPMMQQGFVMPSPEQQKAMLLMSIGKIKSQFSSHPSIITQIQKIDSGLKSEQLSLDDARMRMGQLQGQIMQIKMQQMQASMPQGPDVSPQQQQKAMMLFGLKNIKTSFQGDSQINQKASQIEQGLKDGSLDLSQAQMKMMQMQMLIRQKSMQQLNQEKGNNGE